MTNPFNNDDARRWLAFNTGASDDECKKRFAKRFGYPPDTIRTLKTVKLVGPIREAQPAELDQLTMFEEV